MPQFTPDLLIDKQKGITSVYRNFQKLKFKGKGHEVSFVLLDTTFTQAPTDPGRCRLSHAARLATYAA